MNHKFLLFSLCLASSGFSQVSTNTVCGDQRDFSDVEAFTGDSIFSQAFAVSHGSSIGGLVRINSDNEVSRIFCSGTLISSNRFLTARHCISSDASDMAVTFGYRRRLSSNAPAAHTYRLSRVLEMGSRWDYAIVELSGNPGAVWGWSKLSTQRLGTLPQPALILQHPLGGYMQVATGEIFRRVGSLLYHRVDTEGASSGSPVFTSDGLVAGVHTSGLCDMNSASYNMALELAAVSDSKYLGR